MSVSAINANYNSYSTLFGLTGQAGQSTPAAFAGTDGKNASAAYGAASYSRLGASLQTVMDDMNLAGNAKISFQTLMDYRDQLNEVFEIELKLGLTEYGVDENVNFRLVSKPDGTGVRVITDHEDKTLVEKFFTDNPAMVRRFEQIQALDKMEETRKTQGIDVKAIRDRIQLESMTAWYSVNSSFLSFAQQSLSYYSGINAIA